MRIVQVTTEFAPFAKAGGLGEVVVGLSRELVRQGAQVEVILPKYDFISHLPLQKEIAFTTTEWGHEVANTMWSSQAENCPLHLLEMHHPNKYFQRGKIYGFEDDTSRFLYFTRAVFEYLKRQKEPIDILHLHDWHAAALAPLLREMHREIPVQAIILTIHNLEYQGQCCVHDLAAIGLPKEAILHLRSGSQYNLLKGAIHYADAITTVSPTYAMEILTKEQGFGLEDDLRKRKSSLFGILNGIDQDLWDPSRDLALFKQYSTRDPVLHIVAAKRANRDGFNLPIDAPWFGTITRLASQKGPALIEAAMKEVTQQKGVFILLGSPPTTEIQHHFEQLKKTYSMHNSALIYLEHDEALAHKLYAALDFIVIPSLFEPCGLTQLIAMRYGTIPIVRSTGGLKDTVFDCEDAHVPASKHNGFTFTQASPQALIEAIHRAIRRKNEDPASHQLLIKHGVESDFSWKQPAREYLTLYAQAIKCH